MKVTLKLRPGLEEPEIVILAGAESQRLRELARELEGLDVSPIAAAQGERAVMLEPEQVLRFFTDGRGVSAQTAQGTYSVRERLYELEGRLDPRRFVRISNSEIVNLKKVTGLDLSLTGTIRMELGKDAVCYVSRRYVKKIKQALGL